MTAPTYRPRTEYADGRSVAVEFLSSADPELERAWRRVYEISGSYAASDPRSGEVWQYHGTHAGRHTFRHRSYPWRSETTAPLSMWIGAHQEPFGDDWSAVVVAADPRAADGPRVYLHIAQTLASMGDRR